MFLLGHLNGQIHTTLEHHLNTFYFHCPQITRITRSNHNNTRRTTLTVNTLTARLDRPWQNLKVQNMLLYHCSAFKYWSLMVDPRSKNHGRWLFCSVYRWIHVCVGNSTIHLSFKVCVTNCNFQISRLRSISKLQISSQLIPITNVFIWFNPDFTLIFIDPREHIFTVKHISPINHFN